MRVTADCCINRGPLDCFFAAVVRAKSLSHHLVSPNSLPAIRLAAGLFDRNRDEDLLGSRCLGPTRPIASVVTRLRYLPALRDLSDYRIAPRVLRPSLRHPKILFIVTTLLTGGFLDLLAQGASRAGRTVLK